MVIVQLGSNRGYDGLTKWIQQNNPHITKLILVEPFREHHKSLEECYSFVENKSIDATAIGLCPGNFKLYWTPNDGPLFEVTSLVKDHVIKHWGNQVQIFEMDVEVKTLEQLLDSYQLTEIDWLLIDVEGLDAEVALSFPWTKFNIKKVDIEYIHFGNKKQLVLDMFKNLGYKPALASDLYGYDIAFEK